MFAGTTNNVNAQACVRSIVGWTPLPVPKVTRRRLR
jgi:hypothetical protein